MFVISSVPIFRSTITVPAGSVPLCGGCGCAGRHNLPTGHCDGPHCCPGRSWSTLKVQNAEKFYGEATFS